MALTRDEVQHVAKLARLGLTEADVTKLQGQLSQIIEHFDVLQRFETDGVPPTTHTLPLESVMGADEPTPSLSQAEVLKNAPNSLEGYLRVRAVLEE
jgi:aspartyl-tRNA(Asn)/glutamyl-tRNA(Gln) amidotransferase subunit C